SSTSTGTTVTVNPTPTTPTISAGGPTTFCSGGSVTLTSSSATGNTWSNGATTQAITVTQSGTYTVTVGSAGCSSTSANTTITISSNLQVNVPGDTICSGATATLTAYPSAAGGTFLWSPIYGTNPSLNVQPNNNTTYSVTYSLNGCTATASALVVVLPNPTASFNMSPGFLSTDNQSVTFTNTSSNATSYVWDFGNGLVSNDPNETISYQFNTVGYTITLTAYNAVGCSSSFQVSLNYKSGLLYYVPNSFTPDGDEFNNEFIPIFSSGFDPYNYQLSIYNRWGELLFESFDHTKGWDGSFGTEGLKVQDGTYIWKITFKKPETDDRIQLHGHVNLIR
ncbi:MAG: hypothetical protein RL264_3000, partial [Bacteroidota bacterium]